MEEVSPILVVDDEPLIRLAIVEGLERGGFCVLQAIDGHAALDEINRAQDLRGLVTDIRMGGGPNGWEVAHHGREKFPALAVVYVSGDSVTEWPSNGVPLSTVLQKPFASAELVAAITAQLLARQSNPQPT